MPNWCIGNLKVRGQFKDIKRFLSEEIILVDENKSEFTYISPVIDESNGIKIEVKNNGIWLKNSYKSYFENDIDLYIDSGLRKADSILTLNLGELKSAWEVETELLTKLSQIYKLDFKIYAYEKLMQFNIDFEVHKGEIIKNDKIKFDDYIWECTNPEIGG